MLMQYVWGGNLSPRAGAEWETPEADGSYAVVPWKADQLQDRD